MRPKLETLDELQNNLDRVNSFARASDLAVNSEATYRPVKRHGTARLNKDFVEVLDDGADAALALSSYIIEIIDAGPAKNQNGLTGHYREKRVHRKESLKMETSSSPDGLSSESSRPAAAMRIYSIEFRGTAAEYFRIWIVNLVLTICTLGIYSAWAKVRSRKYLEQNTYIDGANLDYHADPIRILIGRCIVAGLFLVYGACSRISPFLAAAAGVIFASIFPWLMVRAMIFNLGNTSYRNIRFGFVKSYRDSYAAYVKAFFTVLLSIGICFPHALFLVLKFRVDHSRYGSTSFKFKGESGALYKIYYSAVAIYIGSAVVLAIIAGLLAKSKVLTAPHVRTGMIPFLIFFYVAWFFLFTYLRVRVINYVTQMIQLGAVDVHSQVEVKPMAWIYLTNLLGCIFTLGLAYPWAVVRSLKYRLSRTTLIAPPNVMDTFVAGAPTLTTGAGADAAVDFWDIDLGI